MFDKLKKKVEDALPKVAHVAKIAGKALVAGPAVHVLPKVAAAVPADLHYMGNVMGKALAAIPKYAGAVGQKAGKAIEEGGKEAAHAFVRTGEAIGGAAKEAGTYLEKKGRNIWKGFEEEWKQYNQEVIRGVTQKGPEYAKGPGLLDTIDFLLQLRKPVEEEFPILTKPGSIIKKVHTTTKKAIVEGGDRLGNFVYKEDIPVVSDFVGSLFNASDYKEDGSIASEAGALCNGFWGGGVLHAVDGVAGVLEAPFQTAENLNDIGRYPQESMKAIGKTVDKVWDDKVVHGSMEDRSRVAGSGAFEVVLFAFTLGGGAAADGAGAAGEVAEAGGTAAEVGEAGGAIAEAGGSIEEAGEAARAGGGMAEAAKAGEGVSKAAGGGKAGEGFIKRAGGLEEQIAGKLNETLASKIAEKGIATADDVIEAFRRLLDPKGWEPALAEGGMEDEGGYLMKRYKELIKEQGSVEREGGVHINKAEVGDEGGGGAGKFTNSQINDILKNIKGDGFKSNPLRQAYEKEVSELAKLGDDLLAQGKSTEEVAQTLNEARRNLGIKYKDMTPQPLRDYIYEINQGRYNDPLGPKFEDLLESKTYEEIIKSSSKYNPNIDKLLSGFEEWLRRQ